MSVTTVDIKETHPIGQKETYSIGEKEAYHIRRYLIHIGRIRYYCQSRGLPMELQRQMMEHAQWRWRTTMLLDEDTLTDHLSGGLQQSVAMFRASVLKSPLYSEFFIVNIPGH